ncbi:hypothetical protein [Streptomyces sp. NPDC101149]|uniref:hypothetical protein n=1 Tax=Streptomyces sp. NPDC101149 TaxID=3366113 RepID=UPI0037FDB2F3
MKRQTAVLVVSEALAASRLPLIGSGAAPAPAGKPSAASTPAARTSDDRSPVPTPTPFATADGAAARGADANPRYVLKPDEVTPVIGENDGGSPSPVSNDACVRLTSDGGPGMTVLLGPSCSAASFAIDSEFTEAGPRRHPLRPFRLRSARVFRGGRPFVTEVISGSRGKPERSTLVRLVGWSPAGSEAGRAANA